MVLLICGVLLFALLHVVPAALRPIRDKIAAKTGNDGYRGLFSFCLLYTSDAADE